ncbi:DNA damage checkpoint control protein [Wickerhamomyces ciferrii]|uniref:Checkpoint protein n=1 Tax=Wickerhamomyces ciferrii (strain ATCC 14091 / BCRC 22168 / CBS 111 / JCM 3599 / NBRC 0793 / NRRL Y-1031 F-60-10) TaxID=1206466 RepID=K0KFL9_WICCF|nr:DNA damage checkpoint control protein [Wickerhamomyces ciferrii]CCH41721.1 DNA damage checkpoint control protein [Wickerhamomyces ciferrii]
MKLKIYMTQLLDTLASIIGLRKYCVLRFTPTHLNIISAALNEPQVWCKLSNNLFEHYEVESLRDNTISFEMNIEQLLQVLKQFEKSNSDKLAIRLQKKGNDSGKRSASLAVFFDDTISTTNTVTHTFSISVRLLRKESDERINEPELSNVDVLMKLPPDISSLFKRIDRYRSVNFLKIIGSKKGSLSLNVQEENNLNVTITWNEKLQVQQKKDSLTNIEDDEDDENFEILVKLKDWKLGSRICDICKNLVLIISQEEALVLHCYLDDDESCEIIYFISGVNQ